MHSALLSRTYLSSQQVYFTIHPPRTPSTMHPLLRNARPCKQNRLLYPQDPRTPALTRLLPLITFIKGSSLLMTTPQIIKILDLVDPDDPVLAREPFLNGTQLRTLRR